MRGVSVTGKPSDVEVRAQAFVRDNKDLLDTAGPLTLQTIARAGSLIAVELCDEVVQAAKACEEAHVETADALRPGKDLSPKRVAAVESRLPTLQETYERKERVFKELSELAEAAIARCEAGEVEKDAELVRYDRISLQNWTPPEADLGATRQWFYKKHAEPKGGVFSWLFGRKRG